jgi:hypothetical protein
MSKTKQRRRGPFFMIYGYMPNADRVLCGYAHGDRQLARRISQLFEQEPKVTVVEILRYRSMKQTEAEIRRATGTERTVRPTLAPPGMMSEGQTLQ